VLKMSRLVSDVSEASSLCPLRKKQSGTLRLHFPSRMKKDEKDCDALELMLGHHSINALESATEVRTTLTIDDSLLEAARDVANRTGRSMGEIISEWALRGLRGSPGAGKAAKARRNSRLMFPTFPVRADAAPVTGEIIHQLIEDESLPSGH
jgi:hypothetical protein